MTTNRLAKGETQPKRSPQEWVDRGNAILAGQIPMDHKKNAGQFMRRDDVHWFLENGRPAIGWKRSATS